MISSSFVLGICSATALICSKVAPPASISFIFFDRRMALMNYSCYCFHFDAFSEDGFFAGSTFTSSLAFGGKTLS